MKNSITILANKILNHKRTIGIHKTILLFTFVLMMQLISCKKKENINTEKFDWEGLGCTPTGYPVVILSPNIFYSNGGKYITLIPNMSDTGGSDWTGSGSGWSSEPSPAPDHLSIGWFSETENKIYEGEFELPQQKIYNLFKEGYMTYGIPIESEDGKETLHWETYNSLTAGLAPKGMIVVWLEGLNKVEIGRYQAHELGKAEANEVFKRHFKLSGDMPETIDKSEFDKLTPKVQEEIKHYKLSYKQWDDYRLRYNWKVGFNKPLKMYRYFIEYYNGEKQHYLPLRVSQEEYNKKILEPSSKVIPNYINMYVTAKNGRNYQLLLCPPDEIETIEAFQKLEEASPKAIITVFITVDDDFKQFSVTLKNDKKEITLEKALLRLFTLDKSNDLSNEK
jgi:hypothetical protein